MSQEDLEAKKKKLERSITSVISASEARGGKILVSNGSFRGFTTKAEFEAFARAPIRDKRRIATEILRKAVAEFPGEADSGLHRRIIAPSVAFAGAASRWEDFPLLRREKPDQEPIKTVGQRLKDFWLKAEHHKPGLIGVELEFASEYKVVRKKIKTGLGVCQDGPDCCPPIGPIVEKEVDEPLPPATYRDIQDMIPGVRMKSDGSVEPRHSDAQEATLLAGPNGYGRLKKLCALIKERGGFVNKTTGLHVHLDARNDDRRVIGIRAAKLWAAIDILKDLVPNDRLKNDYCRYIPPSFDGGDRYRAINLQSVRSHHTIEVRMGAGSLNPSKIWNWANLLYVISKYKTKINTWEEFMASGIPLHFKIWAVDRANKLRPNEELRKSRIELISPGLDDVLSSAYRQADDECE